MTGTFMRRWWQTDNAFDIGANEHKTIWIKGECDASDLTIRTLNDYMAKEE